MKLTPEYKFDDVDSFFLRKIIDTLLPISSKKPDGSYFIKRHDYNKRLGQVFTFSKQDSKTVSLILSKKQIIRNTNRGIYLRRIKKRDGI